VAGLNGNALLTAADGLVLSGGGPPAMLFFVVQFCGRRLYSRTKKEYLIVAEEAVERG